MLAFMKGIKDIELDGLSNPADIKRGREIFKEILTMIKCTGKFFAKVLLYIYTGLKDAKFRTDYHTLSLIMSTMLVPTFIFERYAFFLAQILTIEDQRGWFNWRREIVKNKSACVDLTYLKKFIAVEEKRNLIRKNTIRRMSSARIIPQREIDYHVNKYKMDMNEFLSHLQVQVNLELDDVFGSDLQAIIEYFKNLDDFINKTFPNAEAEIKIDLMRLILRVTNSTKFVNYIYVLSNMNVDFLNECQIFALFCQVLLAELKKPKETENQHFKECENSQVAHSAAPLRHKVFFPSEPKLDEPSCYNRTTTEVLNTISLEKIPAGSPLRLSNEPDHNITCDSIRRSSAGMNGMVKLPIYQALRAPPLSVFSPKIKQYKDSIKSSESSEEIDLEQESVELSECSPKRDTKGCTFSKFKKRNSLHHSPRMLRRLGHIDPCSSQDLVSVNSVNTHTEEIKLNQILDQDDDNDEASDKHEYIDSTSHNSTDEQHKVIEKVEEEVPQIDLFNQKV